MFKKIKIQITKYYNNKNLILRYIFLTFIVFLILIQFIGNPKKSKPVNYENLNFAGEYLPIGGKYFFNQERLDREIAITKLNTEQFIMIHKRQPQYLPYIEKELKKNNIPEDFKYLAIAESSLRNNAQSNVGAGGIRQFMPSTAKANGLRVDSLIDERFDLEKSTQGAIKYIKKLYRIFNNRTLVAAAYNRGENGLLKDMEYQNMTGYYDLYLNNETSRYVFRILAIKYLIENKGTEFSIDILGEQYKNPNTKTIKINGPIENLAKRSSENNLSYLQVKQLNNRIVSNKLPEGIREVNVFK